MPKLNGRVQEVINVLDGGNVKKFSEKLKNVSQQRLNRIFNLDTRTGKIPDVPSVVLTGIAASLPEVNLKWLLTGEGKMLNNNQTIESVTGTGIVGNNVLGGGINDGAIVNELICVMKKKDEQLEKKDEQIEKLLSIIEKLGK